VGGAGLGYNDPANGNDLQASTFEFVLRERPALMAALTDQRIDTPCFFQIGSGAFEVLGNVIAEEQIADQERGTIDD
jgi:hypothetical protein